MSDEMDGIDVVHIFTRSGCKVSLNGQGHLPCLEHDLEYVMSYLDESAGTDTDSDPRA